MSRIGIVTAGHIATCPRMVKAADALANEGHEVTWASLSHTAEWARHDQVILAGADWSARRISLLGPVGLLRRKWLAWASRRARSAAGRGAEMETTALRRAHSPAYAALMRAVAQEKCDLVLGGTEGGMIPAADAARGAGVPLALDLEDLYSESRGTGGGDDDSIARQVEDLVVPGARVRFAPSGGIASVYDQRYGGTTRVVHNTFPLPPEAPDVGLVPGGPLRLCWFGQTIGGDRGLEDAVDAAVRCDRPVEIALMGRAGSRYRKALEARVGRGRARVKLTWRPPVEAARVIDWCRSSHAGLCLERKFPSNKDLTLANKALTYPLAGLALMCTATAGHQTLARDLRAGVCLYEPGDVDALATAMVRWFDDRAALAAARAAAWDGARRRWHWEHPLERGTFLAGIREALRGACA